MEQKDAFWNVTAEPGEEVLRLAGDLTCDVAIVGGGFTGLRAALALAEAGTQVAVFEAGDVANGASGRSGGQVNPMLPVTKPDDLRRAVGPKYFETLAEAALRSADDLFELVEKYQIRCQARQNGWLRAEHCATARKTSQANARLWNKLGAAFEFVGEDEVTRLTGAHGYVSGTVNARGGAVHPLALARGLDRVARRAGARVYSHARVERLVQAGRGWQLLLNGHRVSARAVVIATNGHTDGLVPGLRRSVLPLTSIQIATEPLPPERLEPLCAGGQTISDTRRLIMYCRREPGGQFIYGGVGYRRPFGGVGGFHWLQKDAPRIFPTLRGVAWRYRWGGTIALTPDRVPHLHEPAPGLLCGLGYNGRGVAMSLVMGLTLARRVLGAAAQDLPFPMSPIRPVPWREPQVAGAGMAMAYWRLRDQREMRLTGQANAHS